MFTPNEYQALARACRALAYHIEKEVKGQQGTSVEERTIDEMNRFRDLAARCESLASGGSAVPERRFSPATARRPS